MQRAVQDQYGGPRVLTLEEVAPPSPARDEVLVRVHASSVTQGDRRLRAADFPGVTAVLGRLMFGLFRPRHRTGGTNFAGEVVGIGAAVVDFSVGDRVFGTVDHGAYAELITVPANARIAPIPPGIDFEAAAAAPYGAGTALTFLREIAAVVPGERVLVVGASGGVGRYAVQIARHLGAEVTAVCSARHAEIVRALGASEVIDYRREDYTRRGERWDVIFDTTSGDGFHAARRCLSERGRYVTVYMNFKVMAQTLISRMLGGPRVRGGVVMGSPALLRGVADLLAAGAISPRIAGRYPLSQLAPAHEALEEGNPGGDIVVAMAPRPRFEPLTTAAVPA